MSSQTLDRDWLPKFETGLKYHNRHSSKSIKVTKLLFCKNDVLIGGSFWQKDSLVTFILFELCLLWYLAQSQILVTSLYLMFEKSNNFDFMNHQIYNITRYISTLSWLFQVFLGFPVSSHNNFVPSFFFLSRFYHKQKRHSLFSGAKYNDKQLLKITLLANLIRFRQFFL